MICFVPKSDLGNENKNSNEYKNRNIFYTDDPVADQKSNLLRNLALRMISIFSKQMLNN